MVKKIEMKQLRKLRDNEFVNSQDAKIFDFMFKKKKLSQIKFETNSKNIWIFPLSDQERNFHYVYTEPNQKFLNKITEEEVHEVLKKINKISQNYFDKRFRQENEKEFPHLKITQIALFFIFLGFALQMWRLFSLQKLDSYFKGNSVLLFHLFLLPWLVAVFVIFYMFFLFLQNKKVNYDTDLALYSKIDSFFANINKTHSSIQWKRGYQGLWIEIKKIEKINTQKQNAKGKKISFNLAKLKN